MSANFFIKINRENKDLFQKVTNLLNESGYDFSVKRLTGINILSGTTFINERISIEELPVFKQISELVDAAKDESGGVYIDNQYSWGIESCYKFGNIEEKTADCVKSERWERKAFINQEEEMVLDIYFPGGEEADVFEILGAELRALFGIHSKKDIIEYGKAENGISHCFVSLRHWNVITPEDVDIMKAAIAVVNERFASYGGKATYTTDATTDDPARVDEWDILNENGSSAEFISEDNSEVLTLHFGSAGIDDVEYIYFR